MDISVQAAPRDADSWLSLAVDAERAGFDTLYVADHPGSGPAPFVALAAAAAVTERVRLGTCVLNSGMWEPLSLANEAATLDLVSNGRALLGIGAGHTPSEWTASGRAYPSAGERVDRMIEIVDATTALLEGDVVTRTGRHVVLDDASLSEPRPVQDRVPLMIGGNGDRVLRFAAERADIVGVSGLGKTLADGHRHAIDWSPAELRRIAELTAGCHVEALVQHVEITDDAAGAAERLASAIEGATADDLLAAPFVWIGTVDEIAESLIGFESELGIGRYVVREAAMGAAELVLDAAAVMPA